MEICNPFSTILNTSILVYLVVHVSLMYIYPAIRALTIKHKYDVQIIVCYFFLPKLEKKINHIVYCKNIIFGLDYNGTTFSYIHFKISIIFYVNILMTTFRK